MGQMRPVANAAHTLILNAVDEATRLRRRLSFDSYTAAVIDHYLKTVQAEQQTMNWRHGGDAYEDTRLNSRQLVKFFNPADARRIPAELVPSLVQALPEPWRGQLATQLCQLLKPEPMGANAGDPLLVLQRMMKESNEGMQSFLALASDGLGNDSDQDLEITLAELIQAREAIEAGMALINAEKQRRAIVARRD